MLAGGWALGAGACAVVDTLLAAMLVEGMAANGWALDAGAWASAGVLLLADGWAGAASGWANTAGQCQHLVVAPVAPIHAPVADKVEEQVNP